MYVEPNTNIYLLSGVPLDREHVNTLYFSNTSEQANYFSSKAVASLTRNTYQRIKRGYARVEGKAETLYKCNYMMFQNSNHGRKWFYAFITSVEYINENCCEIEFEIDNIQTWITEMKLGHCMIERCHTPTDEIGVNLEPESIEFGEYKTTATQTTGYFNDYSLVILATNTGTGDEDPAVKRYEFVSNGLPTGVYALAIANTEENGYRPAFSVLKYLTDTYGADTILNVFLYPSDFLDLANDTLLIQPNPIKKEIKPTQTIRPKDFDGYVPKNNKLFTFPYTCLRVSTSYGTSILTRYEYFKDNTPDFDILSGFSSNPSVTLVPHNYNGDIYTWDLALEINQFPQVAYIVDSYRAWIAQGGMINMIGRDVSSTITTLGNAAVSSYISPILGQYAAMRGTITQDTNTVNAITEIARQKNMPDKARGQLSGNAQVSHKLLNYYFDIRQIRREYAEIVDEYFTMFGYAYNKVGIPNIHARPHYTYIKTANAIVTGNIPSTACTDIKAALNSGITFWVNGNEVGNYSVDNSPS